MHIVEDRGEVLFTTGLLFEINQKILHPVGKSIYYDPDEGLRVVNHTNDPEATIFDKFTFNMGKNKLLKFMRTEGKEAMRLRQEKLGFVVQQIYET